MNTKQHAAKKKLTFADLFAGLGGFHIAMHQIGIKCVFASEWDSHARKTYEHNFKRISPELFSSGNFSGDITEVDPKRIPDFDVLTAGFPCQPFSIAGKRKGFEDERGNAFFDILEIIRAKRPRAYFMENVRHLLSIDGGRTFAKMRKSLESLGYSFHWKVLKACEFGLPQYRPRLYMVGFRDKGVKFEFPRPKVLRASMSDVLGGQCPVKIGRTLLARGYGGKIGQRMNCTEYLVDGEPRHITVEEAKRLMGIPKGFYFPVSVSQSFKQLGNSVAIPVVKAIAAQIHESLATSEMG